MIFRSFHQQRKKMAFLTKIAEFFQNLFNSSSPEVHNRQAMKKIENELKDFRPVIYKNGMVQPNFGEVLRVMFENAKVIDDILSETICSEDIERNKHFEEQLLLTGFDSEAQEIIESLEYENRKKGAMESRSHLNRYFEAEHKKLEKVVRLLNTEDFAKIEKVIDRIKQLEDICRFSYVTAIRLFDPEFTSLSDYTPDFQSVPCDLLETSLSDLYYVCADMDITSSLGQAVLALNTLFHHGESDEKSRRRIVDALMKMQNILRHILTPEILTSLIRLAKKDPEFVPKKAHYAGKARQKYMQYLENKFTVDKNRLSVEIQDETIHSQVLELFGDRPVESVLGYNNDTNNILRQSTQNSLLYVTPLAILKTFAKAYYADTIKTMLNDIVIEGFFNNNAYKSDFSASVYACNETLDEIKEFEAKFKRQGEFDEALFSSLIRDSHKDSDFSIKLKELVDGANRAAKELVQSQTNNYHRLFRYLSEILADAKKPQPDTISNLKILMISSRNRDASEMLEKQYPSWHIFLEIMKNYVIIGTIERPKS